MPETKTCPVCAATFRRTPGISLSRWARRKYCSMACLDRARHVKTGCPITMGGRHCGEPVARWGWCEKHASDHERLHAEDCARCGL